MQSRASSHVYTYSAVIAGQWLKGRNDWMTRSPIGVVILFLLVTDWHTISV